MSSHLKNDILRAGGDEKKVAKRSMKRVIQEFRKIPSLRYLMGTSQAVDIINGGVKGIPVSVVCNSSQRTTRKCIRNSEPPHRHGKFRQRSPRPSHRPSNPRH